MHTPAAPHGDPFEHKAEQIPGAPWALAVNCRQTPLPQACDSAHGAPSAAEPASLRPPSPIDASFAVDAALVVVALDPHADASSPGKMAASRILVARPKVICSRLPQDRLQGR
jgi:hypothetical protein